MLQLASILSSSGRSPGLDGLGRGGLNATHPNSRLMEDGEVPINRDPSLPPLFHSSQLNASLRIRFVISHDAPPQNTIKQIGIDHVGVIEIESLGCLRPPRTVVQEFHGGGD